MFRARLILAASLVLGLLAASFWFLRYRPATSRPSRPVEDPRLTFATHLENVRPDVQYVGDKVCNDCHPAIGETYRRHPMGRSVAPVARLMPAEHFGKDAQNPFEASGLQLQVEARKASMVHK